MSCKHKKQITHNILLTMTLRKYKDAIVISTKNDMHEYCPSYEQMEEARKLNGLLFSCML